MRASEHLAALGRGVTELISRRNTRSTLNSALHLHLEVICIAEGARSRSRSSRWPHDWSEARHTLHDLTAAD